jgi:enoyl-CoA hydratase/carnithine racemase
MEFALTGDKVSSKDAERLGLVSRVVPADRLMQDAMELAKKLAVGPTKAIALTKRALNKSISVGLDEDLQYESYL